MMETVLRDDVSRCGLRRIHVLSDQPIDRDAWMQRVPVAAIDTVRRTAWLEPGVNYHHLWMYWYVREVVQIGGMMTVLWRVGRGMTLRQAAEDAAMEYLAHFDRLPSETAVRTLPKGTSDHLELADGRIRMTLAVDLRVPLRCVCVR